MSQREESLGTREESQGLPGLASEDTAEAREPAWCHLLSSGWSGSSRSEGLDQLVGGWVYFLSFSFSRRERYRLGSVR